MNELLAAVVVVQLLALMALGMPRARVALAARKQATGATKPLTARERVEAEVLPPDLEAVCDSESEAWARDDMRAALRDRYLERRSWDRVRADLIAPHGGDA